MKKRSLRHFLAIIPLLVFACTLGDALTPTEAPPQSTEEPAPTPIPTAISPTETPRSEISLYSGCVPAGSPELIANPTQDRLPGAILDFLNQGGALEELDQALYDAVVANLPTAVASADFTGDGLLDVAVSVFDPTSSLYPPAGQLLVYTCVQGQYELAFLQETQATYGGPHLWFWQDLNADGAAELVYSETQCGAHTCFEDVQVLSWTPEGIRFLMEPSTMDLPYARVGITDFNGDGIFQIEVSGSGFGSVGAGPQREISRIWEYAPFQGVWTPGGDILGPSNYRIHALHDAETTAWNGEMDIALVLYWRVIQDPALEAWAQPEIEWANLSAFAYYKLVALYTLRGEESQAVEVLEEMGERVGEESSQRVYYEMAILFRDVYAASSLENACVSTAGFAGSNRETILEPLGSLVFGYANRDFDPEDMCPVRGP